MGENRPVVRMGIPAIGGHQQQHPFDLREAVQATCDKCNGALFDKVYRLGNISQMAPSNKTGQNVRVEFVTYTCRGCGHEYGTPLTKV